MSSASLLAPVNSVFCDCKEITRIYLAHTSGDNRVHGLYCNGEITPERLADKTYFCLAFGFFKRIEILCFYCGRFGNVIAASSAFPYFRQSASELSCESASSISNVIIGMPNVTPA